MGLHEVRCGRSLRSWLVRLVVVVVGLALTAACGGAMGKSYPPYRYRLTVEVETPQGLRTGSSVIEVRTAMAGPNSIPSPGALSIRAKGQAVAVDLPNGQTLFALLRSDRDRDWLNNAYLLQVPYPTVPEVKARTPDGKWTAAASFDLVMERVQASRGVFVLPRRREVLGRQAGAWPMFARFRNIRAARSVEPVNPDDLSATFGKGYAVRRLTVERTDDPVTTGIAARLPKADERGFFNWDGQSNPDDPEKYAFGMDDFARGVQ